jgi:hypothetical protein
VGEEVPFGQENQGIAGHKDAADAFGRMVELLKENKFPVDQMKYVMGKRLAIDPKTEFSDDEGANRILKPVYRKGFEVPERV